MSSYINNDLRQLIAMRAAYLCAYCLIHESDTSHGCQVDHIISLKHDGVTAPENLAYACVFCNRHKGTDVGSVVWPTQQFVRFYNPRKDRWTEHFKLDGALIRPLTDIGKATAQIFGFNHSDRVLERQVLMAIGKYPGIMAKERMKQ